MSDAHAIKKGKGAKKSQRKIESSREKNVSPNDMAFTKLSGFLGYNKKDPHFTHNVETLKNMLSGDQFRYMNMYVLSRALLFLRATNYVATTTNEQNRINSYVKQIIDKEKITSEKYSNVEMDIVKLRMEATLIRYIEYVIDKKNKLDALQMS